MTARKYLFLIVILILSSCTNQKPNKPSYWGPQTNYSVLFKGEQPIQCGIVYSGHFKKIFLAKENQKKSKIANCAKNSEKQSKNYVIEYHLSYLPDLYQIRKIVFQPNRKGIVITYSEESIGSWDLIDVENCSLLYSKKTKLFMNSCISSTELKKLL